MPNEVALLPETDLKAVIALDETVKSCQRQMIQAEQSGNQMLKALVLARATLSIRNQLLPMMGDIMNLVGTPLGFRTDRDREPEKYDKGIVCNVVTVALLRGFQVVGNEFNIIAGNFYGTKEGFARLLREFDRFTDLRVVIGVAQNVGEIGALVPIHATWKLNGVSDEMNCSIIRDAKGQPIADTRIAVRVNKGMGADAITGKAESKLLRRIYQRLTGSEVSSVEDVGDGDTSDVLEATTVSPTVTEPVKPVAVQQETSEEKPKVAEPVADTGAEFRLAIEAAKTEAEARFVYDTWYGPDSSRESGPGEHERDHLIYQERVRQIRDYRTARAEQNAPNAPATGKQSKGGKRQGSLV